MRIHGTLLFSRNGLVMIQKTLLKAFVASLTLGVFLSIHASVGVAAEQECVGVLALAVLDDVAVQLKLTSEQKSKLMDLIDQRESEAVGPAMQYRDLSAKERAEKLAPFRKESETQGLAILTPEQQTKLEQIRIRRLGMASLAEPSVVEKFGLSDEQKKQVADLIDKRDIELAKADEKAARIIQAQAERNLAAVLNEKQKTAWEAISGGESPRTELAKTEVAPTAVPSPTEKTSPETVSAAKTAENVTEKTNEKTSEKPSAAKEEPKSPAIAETPAEKTPEASAPANSTDQSKEKSAIQAFANKDDIKPSPAAEATPAKAAKDEPKKHPEKLRFNFRYAPWKDVMDWFAQQADMSLVMETAPPGTFNYTDDKEYTPTEAIDLLGNVLLLKGYMLIRNERMLFVINKADGIPPGLVQTITPDELDKRGKFELVTVLFNLDKLSPEEAEPEIKKLLGPEGLIVALPKPRQILVTDTGGRLKAVRTLIQRVEDPQNVLSGQIRTIELKQAPPEMVLPIVRQMLDIPDEKNVTTDGSLRLAIDPSGRRIIATGKPEKIARLEEIIKVVDVVKPGGAQVGSIDTTPQLVIYPITSADPQSVLSVLQTLMQGQPDLRLALDAKTNNLIALARPADHATIRATIDDMQHDGRRMEVIRLRSVDPQLALAAICKLFGITTDPKTTPPNAPSVQAETTTRQLFVQGTDGQIAQIRQLLEKMGESEVASAEAISGSNVRMINVSPRAARSILEQIQGVWPSAHKNKIREVSPSAVIPSMTPSEGAVPSNIPQHLIDQLREEAPRGSLPPQLIEPRKTLSPPAASPPPAMGEPAPEDFDETHALPARPAEEENHTASSPMRVKARFVAQEISTLPPAAQATKPLASAPDKSPKNATPETPKKDEATAGAPIVISIGPGGVMIASEDLKALDEFEKLFTSLAGAAANGNPNMTIFYLKHAKAATVAETLDQIFGGGTLQQSDGGGGLLGDLAGAAMGDAGGGLVGSLLGGMGGGSIKPSGSVKITPDPRLNALVVQANPVDVDTIEQLLKILDQKGSPEEILIAPKPRMIPLMNTDAEKMAEIVKSTFQNRLEAAGAQGGNQPNPMQLLQMLRGGGRRGGGGGGGTQAQEIEKMTVTADTRTNSLIVAASDALFQDVKELVEKLDVISTESNEAVMTIPTHHASTEAIQAGLQSILGDNVQFTRSGAGSSGSRPQQSMPMFGQGMGGSRRSGQFGGGQFGGGGNRGGQYGGGGNRGGGGQFGGGGGQFGGGQFGGGGGQNFGGGGNRGGGGSGGNRGGGGGGRGGRGG